MSNQNLTALRQYLDGIASGEVSELEQLPDLLARCWNALMIADMHGMKPEKLDRMEQVRWNQPILSFDIERHGGTVKGSVYAEVQTWSIDVELLTASCTSGGKRLKRERQQRLKVEPLAEKVVHLIEGRRDDERLHWLSDSHVRVLIGNIIPDGTPQQTVVGRRKRFSKCLEQALKQRGWVKVSGTSPHTYQRV